VQVYFPGKLKSPDFNNPDERNDKYSFGLFDPNAQNLQDYENEEGM